MASSISSISSMINSKNRMTGLVSGLDTETLVKQMLKADQMKIDKAKQDKTLLEWKRDDYRTIINTVKTFRDTYMDTLSATNMRSQNSYKAFSVTSSDSAYVTATGSADASAGVHSIKISNLATAETKQSATGLTRNVESVVLTDADASAAAASGKSFTFTVDGVTKVITIDTVTDAAGLVASIQNKLDAAFGSNKVGVSITDNKLTFKATASGVNKLTIGGTGVPETNALSALGFDSGANYSNRLNLSGTIDDMSKSLKDSGLTYTTVNGQDSIFLVINGKQFKFSKDTTLSSMMSQINSDSTANVNMRYDEINDKFVITSKQTGQGSNVNIGEYGSNFFSKTGISSSSLTGNTNVNYNFDAAGEFFSVNLNGITRQVKLDNTITSATNIQDAINAAFEGTGQSVTVVDNAGKLTITSAAGSAYIGEPTSGSSALAKLGITANYVAGEDSMVSIDGQDITRSSNVITVAGVTYTLLKETGTDSKTISLTADVDKVYNNIKTFVDKYNELISTINSEISEKYDRDYPPLTDEQREAMSDDDIKAWEEKARTGMLHGDSALTDMLDSMRRALYDSIGGVAGSLYSIGITTSSDYKDKGKLVIDENVLKDKIKNAPDLVMNVFSKESSYSYNDVLADGTKRNARYSDNGIVNRLYDVIQDNIRTTRDYSSKTGQKGILIEKAGIIGDVKEFEADLPKQIDAMNTSIADMLERLTEKEDNYYAKFANLETVLNQMNSQSSWLSQQLGTSS